jgi:biopolymer transport protein ExbB
MTHALVDVFADLTLAAGGPPEVAFDPATMWRAMGPFAKLVAGVLVAMGVYSLSVMAERLVFFTKSRRTSRQFAQRLDALLRQGRLAEAEAAAKEHSAGHLPRALGPALAEHGGGPADEVVSSVTRALERGALYASGELRRGLSGLATVGSTAPFVGLLGTVAGIISAFQAMAATGSGGLGSVSQGIAEALVTTAFGLLVAIPAVMMFNHLTTRVEEMQQEMGLAAHELLDFFAKRGRGVRAPSSQPVPPLEAAPAEPVVVA